MDQGIIIDVETTGLDSARDRIIEVGVVEFVRGTQPGDVQIVGVYSAVEDPGEPLSLEIQQLTGLTDATIAGRRIDWNLVAGMIADASIVIAHNAQFDAAFLMRIPVLRALPIHWACSLRHIDWENKGFKARKLTYLAADAGFINPFPHRAVFDCSTTLRLIGPYLDELVQNSYQREIQVFATNAPFETKDVLKARGYHWDASQRVWSRIVSEARLEEERRFLSEQIYKHRDCSHIEQVLPPLGGAAADLL